MSLLYSACRNKSEADNVTWILCNTKNCPSCKQPIEKNQGCMHMVREGSDFKQMRVGVCV